MMADRDRALIQEWERLQVTRNEADRSELECAQRVREALLEACTEIEKLREQHAAAMESMRGRVIELQSELDAAKRNLAWQQSEAEEERIGHNQERDQLRGRLAEEREAHVARALEAKNLLEQARIRALAAEDEVARLRRELRVAPRPDQSPGGYSMTEIEIREEVVTDPEASGKRRGGR